MKHGLLLLSTARPPETLVWMCFYEEITEVSLV